MLERRSLFLMITAVLSLGFSLGWRRLALRWGHSAPIDPLHPRPTALSGGIGFVAGALLAQAVAGFGPRSTVIWTGGLAYFALGLWDDIRPFSPRIKFIGQIVIALFLVYDGARLPFHPTSIAAAMSVFWILAVVNSLNLI